MREVSASIIRNLLSIPLCEHFRGPGELACGLLDPLYGSRIPGLAWSTFGPLHMKGIGPMPLRFVVLKFQNPESSFRPAGADGGTTIPGYRTILAPVMRSPSSM